MITYSKDTALTPEQLADVFRRSGLRRPVEDLARMKQMLARSDVLLTAWDGERCVGVARALCDFCFCCYLSDLAVDVAYQRQGIGKELVRRLEAEIGPDSLLLLLAAPEAMAYYPHIGFEPVSNAWHKPRRR